MVVLSLVVLAKLIIVVLMFLALRPGLPRGWSRSGRRRACRSRQANTGSNDRRLLAATAAAILPFFAYYAAWGFLGNTVREYSRLGTRQGRFRREGRICFNILSSRGLLLSIAICWVVRWAAERSGKAKRAKRRLWRLLIVAADASWIFIGLYGLSIWKESNSSAWLGAGKLPSAT
ncbi:hypothetical protein [Ensifer canadensis]